MLCVGKISLDCTLEEFLPCQSPVCRRKKPAFILGFCPLNVAAAAKLESWCNKLQNGQETPRFCPQRRSSQGGIPAALREFCPCTHQSHCRGGCGGCSHCCALGVWGESIRGTPTLIGMGKGLGAASLGIKGSGTAPAPPGIGSGTAPALPGMGKGLPAASLGIKGSGIKGSGTDPNLPGMDLGTAPALPGMGKGAACSILGDKGVRDKGIRNKGMRNSPSSA